MPSCELTVLMPVFNERSTIARAVEEVLAVELPVASREVLVVDDGSTDGTSEELAAIGDPDVRVVTHASNRGKGAAVRTGLDAARGRLTIVVDADLELDPADIARLVPLVVGTEDVAVFGVRDFPKNSARKLRYLVGNRAVTIAANVLFRAKLGDVMTGYKLMPTELFRSLPLRERGFGIEPEIASHLLRRRVPIRQVPVRYVPRARKAGKKLTMLDGLVVVRVLVRCRFAPALTHEAGGRREGVPASQPQDGR